VRKIRLAELIGKLFCGIQGALPVIPDNGSMPDQVGLINAIISANPFPATAYNAAANTTGFTATQQQIMSAEVNVLNLNGTLGAGAALTLPTVASMLATMTPFQALVGASTTLRVMNSGAGAFIWTVTTNTGWTLNGPMTVPNGAFRDFFVTITGVGASAAATLQDIGTANGTTE
jgi:hypothetical protein